MFHDLRNLDCLLLAPCMSLRSSTGSSAGLPLVVRTRRAAIPGGEIPVSILSLMCIDSGRRDWSEEWVAVGDRHGIRLD